jgi:hypothetical protein
MTVEGDYTCDICGESFDRNVDIATHVQSHQSSIDPNHILAEFRCIYAEVIKSAGMVRGVKLLQS